MNRFTLLVVALNLLVTQFIPAQAQKNMTLLGQLTYNDNLNDVWGYADGSGNEYALVGAVNGVSIVDVSTNPAQPTELHFMPGVLTTWRDLKTFGQYAYVSNEGGDGIRIIDLSGLPSNIRYKDTTIGGAVTAHNVWVDDHYLYVVGMDNFNGGLLIFDLLNDPWNPEFVGSYDDRYVHDIYVRGNIGYSAEINDGLLTILDLTNKANPRVLGSRSYTNSFTHNTWLNAQGDVCFTTDELSNAYIYAWDITDPTDIEELDRIRSSLSGGRATPHNVHVLNDFIVTSYYKDGVQIVDANRPQSMVEVGYFDTNELENGGTSGCWGAYPFLPSGKVLATDMAEGLFVFDVDYVRASYLQGRVTDASDTNPLTNGLNNAVIRFLSDSSFLLSGTNGDFNEGRPDAGTYRLAVSKLGFNPDTVTVQIVQGQVSNIDIPLQPAAILTLNIEVLDDATGDPIPAAFIQAVAPNDEASFSYSTDINGRVSDNAFFSGAYNVVAGKWGYRTRQVSLTASPGMGTLTIRLEKGYYDDFIFDFGWQAVGSASSGQWERGIPIETDMFGTIANPGEDVLTDFGREAYVTGNGGGEYFTDDIDDGTVVLTSPSMDLTTYQDPVVSYQWWFLNWLPRGGGQSRPGDDSLRVDLIDGSQIKTIASYDVSFGNKWNQQAPIRVKDFFPNPGNDVKIRFTAADEGSQEIVEAAVDQLDVREAVATSIVRPDIRKWDWRVWPNPSSGMVNIQIDGMFTRNEEGLSLEVMNPQGQIVRRQPLKSIAVPQQIEMTYPAGVYLILLKHQGQTVAASKLLIR
ncbi:MAG: choice-of-anchor B family protein [Bacteroidota bacterium]